MIRVFDFDDNCLLGTSLPLRPEKVAELFACALYECGGKVPQLIEVRPVAGEAKRYRVYDKRLEEVSDDPCV